MAKQATPHNVRLSGPFPLHRGPFLFAPEFLSESDWYPNFQALIGEILFRRGIAAKLFRARARVARVEFGRFDMTINGQRGTFSVQSANAEYSELDAAVDDQLAPTGPPAHFLKQLRDPYVAEYLHDDFTEIKWLAEDLIRQMRERFQKALEAGNAELTAHVGKLSSLPVRLDFRLLQRLSLRPPKPDPDYRSEEDLQLDEGVADNGELFYLVGISPSVAGVRGKPASKPKSGRGPGWPPRHSIEDYEPTIFELLKDVGVPSPTNPRCRTKSHFISVLMKRLGPKGPRKTWIDENLSPVIKKYRKSLPTKTFR
jgi:hypothetical protein